MNELTDYKLFIFMQIQLKKRFWRYIRENCCQNITCINLKNHSVPKQELLQSKYEIFISQEDERKIKIII